MICMRCYAFHSDESSHTKVDPLVSPGPIISKYLDPRIIYLNFANNLIEYGFIYVIGFTKTDQVVTFCISRNTVSKYGSSCGSPVLHYSHTRITV